MLRPLLLAALVAAGGAAAAPAFDPRAAVGGIGGSAPTHVDGTDGDGVPVVHRPDAPSAGASAGVGAKLGGAEDNAVTYRGAARGTLGFPTAPTFAGTDDGRPILSGR